jgi:hypothetical protein
MDYIIQLCGLCVVILSCVFRNKILRLAAISFLVSVAILGSSIHLASPREIIGRVSLNGERLSDFRNGVTAMLIANGIPKLYAITAVIGLAAIATVSTLQGRSTK